MQIIGVRAGQPDLQLILVTGDLAQRVEAAVLPVQLISQPDAARDRECTPAVVATDHGEELAIGVAHRVVPCRRPEARLVGVRVIGEPGPKYVAPERLTAEPKSGVDRRARNGAEAIRFLAQLRFL